MDTGKLDAIAEAIAGPQGPPGSASQIFRFGDVESVTGDTVVVNVNGALVPTVNLCAPSIGARVLIAIQGEIWMCLAAVGGSPPGIGDIIQTDNPAHPSTRWPGTTWQAISGKTLFGYSSSDTEFNTIGKTGGEKNVSLTASQMPSHEGHIWLGSGSNPPYEGNAYGIYLATGDMSSYGANSRGWQNYNGEYLPASRNLGGGGSHNNLPPYQVTYVWKRTG